ncbi:hypothetical protein ES705_38775 [subsurface metagenome]
MTIAYRLPQKTRVEIVYVPLFRVVHEYIDSEHSILFCPTCTQYPEKIVLKSL